MAVVIEGLDELDGELKNLVERLEQAGGELPIAELPTPDFIRSFTEFDSLLTFMDTSPWTINSAEDFEGNPAGEFDRYVKKYTDVGSWDAFEPRDGSTCFENPLDNQPCSHDSETLVPRGITRRLCVTIHKSPTWKLAVSNSLSLDASNGVRESRYKLNNKSVQICRRNWRFSSQDTMERTYQHDDCFPVRGVNGSVADGTAGVTPRLS